MAHTLKELQTALWSAADELRTTMSADVYKDYLLGLVFYKALSDNILNEVHVAIEGRKAPSLDVAQKVFEESWANEQMQKDLEGEMEAIFGCSIGPDQTFLSFHRQVDERTFMLENLSRAFRDIEASNGDVYSGLFDDFDIMSKDLGKTPAERNRLISSVISRLAAIDFTQYPEDALGDAYEYLIAQFASESGKKAGEFYTPQAVSQIMAKIVTLGQDEKYRFSVYDPCCGSGSLLLQIRRAIKNTNLDNKSEIDYFGQELKNQTFNLVRMNMMLHRVPAKHQHLRNADTLDADWPTEEPTNFDSVVMNPPYSQKYNAKEGLLLDPRFAPYKKLPPASKADMAFLLHGLYHLKNTGTMAIVLPHGVLFRGAAEGTIREELLKKGQIYAVIGLPAGIFYSTGIPTCVVVLKKERTVPEEDISKLRDVLFIDASKDFRKGRAQNYLDEEHIEKIVNAYKRRKDIEKYAHLASFEEIEKNGFNLNIPRYVDTSEEEEELNLEEIFAELAKIDAEERELAKKLNESFAELGLGFRL